MTTWIKMGDLMSATINGRDYAITRLASKYMVWCDGDDIGDPPYCTLENAKAAAEAHAATPLQPKPGIHIDDVAGQQLIDILKRSFTTARIQDFMDASPYDEPDTGAPEGGPLG